MPVSLKRFRGHWVQRFLDLLYPRDDLFRDYPAECYPTRNAYITPESLKYLRLIREPVCTTCGFPLDGQTENVAGCAHCEHLDPAFEGNRSVIQLNGFARKLIHEFKYHDGRYLEADLAAVIGRSTLVAPWIEGAVLVPIPLHPNRLRKRGYNQSELLARIFAKEWGSAGTQVMSLLRRTHNTMSQTRMDRIERLRNTRGAFEMLPCSEFPKDQLLVLVDDVFTSGATTNACARVLRKRGFRKIRVLTFGHG
jgi:ComF family protein